MAKKQNVAFLGRNRRGFRSCYTVYIIATGALNIHVCVQTKTRFLFFIFFETKIDFSYGLKADVRRFRNGTQTKFKSETDSSGGEEDRRNRCSNLLTQQPPAERERRGLDWRKSAARYSRDCFWKKILTFKNVHRFAGPPSGFLARVGGFESANAEAHSGNSRESSA